MSDIVSEYRELLTSDESIASLENAIRLAAQIATGNRRSDGKGWYRLLKASPLRSKRTGSATAQKLKEVQWALFTLPRQVTRHLDRLPEDQYSLLMDALLIVFHQAYFALLPRSGAARARLLGIFESFSETLPRAADRFQTTGLIEIERGRRDAAAESFRAAVASTHSDDHDFVTRVQMMWTVLMEQKRWRDAFQILMDVYARAARNDLDEVRYMLSETFNASRSPSQKAS
jgi:hypothetical protein